MKNRAVATMVKRIDTGLYENKTTPQLQEVQSYNLQIQFLGKMYISDDTTHSLQRVFRRY